MLKRIFICTTALGVLILCALSVPSALRLRPASEVLREPANILVLVQATERLDQTHIRFEVVKLYSDERVEILLDAQQGAKNATTASGSEPENTSRYFDVRVGIGTEVIIGGTYIIGISRYLRGRFPLPKWRLDPLGFRLVEVPVVGDAIFTHSRDLEYLLTVPADTPGRAPRKTLDPILRLLRGSPVADRRIAVLEMFFQSQLGKELAAKEIGKLRSIIENESEDTVVRDYLLQATTQFPDRNEPDWVAASTRTVLGRAPLKVELGSTTASFQHTALRILKERGNKDDLDLAARMLRSASPGVTLSALQTMEELDPERALVEARAALKIDELPEQSKKYISGFVKRLEQRNAPTP